MFRFSFLAFLLMYLCGSFFRASIEDLLFHELLRSVLPANHFNESRYNGREDWTERALTRGCADGGVCHQGQHETRRTQRTDDFGDNGPLDRRYADPT